MHKFCQPLERLQRDGDTMTAFFQAAFPSKSSACEVGDQRSSRGMDFNLCQSPAKRRANVSRDLRVLTACMRLTPSGFSHEADGLLLPPFVASHAALPPPSFSGDSRVRRRNVAWDTLDTGNASHIGRSRDARRLLCLSSQLFGC